MLSNPEAKDLVNQIFEEEALLLAGIVAVHRLEDDVVWRIARNFDLLRCRVLRRLDSKDAGEARTTPPHALKPHPAIDHLLQAIRTG